MVVRSESFRVQSEFYNRNTVGYFLADIGVRLAIHTLVFHTMTTLNFDEGESDLGENPPPKVDVACCPITNRSRSGKSDASLGASQDLASSANPLPSSSSTCSSGQQGTGLSDSTFPSTEKILVDLVRQTQENTILLHQALAELRELREQVQTQRKYPFTVKTFGFERELVVKAKELFITHGPWLIQGSLNKIKEKIQSLLGGPEKADAHHVTSCLSYCKEKYTLWRADIRKKVLNKKFNHLKITEFTQKLYAPFKSKEEDMKNATKTAILLRKFARESGYFEDPTKSDFWEKFVDFVNLWNNVTVPNKWVALRLEDESTYKESLVTTH